MEPADLARRAKAIRLPMRQLAVAAGRNENTVGRTLSPRRKDGATDPRGSTSRVLREALIAEELRLRDYLVALHPLQAAHQVDAAAQDERSEAA